MERNDIIKNEVKNSLSQFGLNDTERDEYVTLTSSVFENEPAETSEEDFTNKVKNHVALFIPSAKLLQKTRTALQQASSESAKKLDALSKEFEDYKKNNPEKKEEKKDAPEPKNPNQELLDTINALRTEIVSIKTEVENEKKQKAVSEKKAAILKSVKLDYNEKCASIIELLAERVDFSQEDAMDRMKTEAANFAKSNPTQLFAASKDEGNSEKLLDIFKTSFDDKEEKEREKAYNNRLL